MFFFLLRITPLSLQHVAPFPTSFIGYAAPDHKQQDELYFVSDTIIGGRLLVSVPKRANVQ